LKISLVTAVYNREDTILDALKSAQSQSYKNVEHVIIDGASTDATLDLIEKSATAHTRVFSEADSGIYDALNKGIARATGDVIGLLHSDDFFASDTVLTKVAAAFADPNIDAVYGDLDYVAKADTTRIIRHWKSGNFTKAKLRRGWMPPHPTLFLRKSVFERFGDYDTTYQISADYDAILRWFGKEKLAAAYLPEVLVKMRVGGESNKSLKKILQKSREDYRALRRNNIGGFGALFWKNASKIQQFIAK